MFCSLALRQFPSTATLALLEIAEVTEAKPRRHGCLTAFLVVMVIANTFTALLYLLYGDAIAATLPNATPTAFIVLTLVGASNVIFAFALLKWKKWGFYGFAATALIVLGTNLAIGIGVAQALFGFAGVGVLYWTLQMGKERKAWPHLE